MYPRSQLFGTIAAAATAATTTAGVVDLPRIVVAVVVNG